MVFSLRKCYSTNGYKYFSLAVRICNRLTLDMAQKLDGLYYPPH